MRIENHLFITIALSECCYNYFPALQEFAIEDINRIGRDCRKISSENPLWLGDCLKTHFEIPPFGKISPWEVIAIQMCCLEIGTGGQFSEKGDQNNPLVQAIKRAKEKLQNERPDELQQN